MLKPVDMTSKPYCGPVAIATITGKPIDKVIAAIQRMRYGAHWRRRKDVKPVVSMQGIEIGAVLADLGWRMILVKVEGVRTEAEAVGMLQAKSRIVYPYPRTLTRPTLAAWMRKRSYADAVDAFIVQIDRHWIAVQGRKMCDTFTEGQPVFIRKGPHRRARVRRVFRVERAK